MTKEEKFSLDPVLAKDTIEITRLKLCHVGFMNDKRYPWLVMVPQKPDLIELIDLDQDDQIQLMREINTLSHIMQTLFNPFKLNTASLGNMVRQLHIHLIARQQDDPAWPGPVWNIGEAIPYQAKEASEVISSIRSAIMNAPL